MFHTLNTKVGSIRFNGSYHFGETSGRLMRKAGWVTIKGKKLALNGNGKLYTNRWYKGYYLLSDGTIATSRHISGNIYVDIDGKRCTKEEVRLGKLKKKLQSTISGYSGTWSVYVKDMKTGDGLGGNTSTARDVGKLLERIYQKKAFSREYSGQMLNLLLNQTRRS